MLTAEQKATLLSLLAANGLSETEPYAAANALNAGRTQAIAQPKPFGVPEILGVIGPAHQGAIMSVAIAPLAIQAMSQQDRPAVGLYAAAFHGSDLLSDSELAAIQGVLAETVEVQVPAPSLFATAFPGFAYTIERQVQHASSSGGVVSDEQGNPILFTEREHCTACTAALIEEARA